MFGRSGRGSPRALAEAAPLYGVFALTGVGTALLGATLPALRVRWGLTDGSAGMLFLVLFVASSLGSMTPRRNSTAIAAGGAFLVAFGSMALGATRGRALFPETAVFGFGLGFTISTVTRVRLLCAEAERVREVNRINLVWGLGAFLCPAAANQILRHAGVPAMFSSLAGLFGIFAVWTWSAALQDKNSGPSPPLPEQRNWKPLPWLTALAAFLVVGLESSCGAWLATYTQHLKAGWAPVEAITLFWLGLLASRALCSTAWMHRFSEKRLLLGSLALTALGCASLVASQAAGSVLAAAMLLGMGIGPVFPMLLAVVLPRVRGNAILVIAGTGSAVLPWITGMLSQRSGSLRMGLAAPVLAGAALLVMGPRLVATLEAFGHPVPE